MHKLPRAGVLFCQHHASRHQAKVDRTGGSTQSAPHRTLAEKAGAHRGRRRHAMPVAVGAPRRGCWIRHERAATEPTRHHAWRIIAAPCRKAGTTRFSPKSARRDSGRCYRCRPCCWASGEPGLCRTTVGPDVLPAIENQPIKTANSFFSQNVVNEISNRPSVTSFRRPRRSGFPGFVISFWAGLSHLIVRGFRRRGATRRPSGTLGPSTIFALGLPW